MEKKLQAIINEIKENELMEMLYNLSTVHEDGRWFLVDANEELGSYGDWAQYDEQAYAIIAKNGLSLDVYCPGRLEIFKQG